MYETHQYHSANNASNDIVRPVLTTDLIGAG